MNLLLLAMLALSQSRFLRFFIFGMLYLAQGVPAGFISVGFVIFMTDQGLGNGAISSTIGLMAIPWAFKVLWAPLLDRVASTRFGRRRPFIIVAELCMGLTLLPLLVLNPKHDLWLISSLLFLHSTFAALQDTAVDALAVDLLQPHEQATANGLMWAGKSVGIALGGGGGAVFAKQLGWPALIITITAVLWTIMLLMVVLPERPAAEVTQASAKPRLTLNELRRSFAFGTPLLGVAIAMLTPVGFMLIIVVYTRLLRADLGLSASAIGLLQGVIEPLSGIVGALSGGFLADRLGVRKVIAGSMACMGASMTVFAAAPGLRTSFAFLVVVSMVGQFFGGAYNAALTGFLMRLSNPAVGATQITIFMAAINLSAAWATPLGGHIADAYGVSAVFGVAAAAQFVFIGLLPLCNPRLAELRFRKVPPEPQPDRLFGQQVAV